MTSVYPTSIDSFQTHNIGDVINPDFDNEQQEAITALETKVGVTNSADNASLDYKTSEVTAGDKAVGKSATQTLTNKTLGSGTKVTIGSDADKDMYYRASDGTLTRIPIGTDNQILKLNGTTPNWETETVTVDATSSVKGIVELATAAEITAGTATGGTGAALVVTPDQLLSARPVTDVQSFTTAGTTSWTKPNNAKWVDVYVIGAGGAGGAGAAGTNNGGGAGGGWGMKRFMASALGSTESLTVGAGGTPVANSSGNAGGATTFGTTTLLRATGGAGGTNSVSSGGTANGDIFFSGGNGGQSGGTGPVDTTTNPSPRGGGAAGYNGGAPSTPTAGQPGGAFTTNYVKAGSAGGTTAGTSGTSTTGTVLGLMYGGVGGGGAGYNGSGTGGNGGNGQYGSGGGGAIISGNTGGTGGDGVVIVVTYF